MALLLQSQTALTKPGASVRRQPLNGEWSLWFDEEARWQEEDLVLDPSDLSKVPVYRPSVGWAEMLEKDFSQYQLGHYFKNPEGLCRLIGIVQGTGFSREVEATRLSEAASGLALNGWQSHTGLSTLARGGINDAENSQGFWTSGLVDPLRNPNFPPEMLESVNRPLHLALVPTPSRVYSGRSVQIRFALINEAHAKGPGELTLRMVTPDGDAQLLGKRSVEIMGDPLKFVQDLWTTEVAPRGASGYYKLHAELKLPSGSALDAERTVLVENPAEWELPTKGIALIDPGRALRRHFEGHSLFFPEPTSPQSRWQPVELIYDPEPGGFESATWDPEELKSAADQGKSILFWASDVEHGKRVVAILRDLELIPPESSVVPLGLHWFGGWNFNTPHPVFAGLPAPVIFNEEYSGAFGYWGISHFPGTMMAGLINAPPRVAVTLGELPFRKGKMLVCALDLVPSLDNDPVADRILAQLLNYVVASAAVSADQLRGVVAGKSAGVASPASVP